MMIDFDVYRINDFANIKMNTNTTIIEFKSENSRQ